jgi:hypothetical protein
MNKIIIAFLGDPGLQYLAWLGGLVAAAIALVSMPWIATQLTAPTRVAIFLLQLENSRV